MYLYPILSFIGALLALVGEVIKSDKHVPGARDWPKIMVTVGAGLVILVALLSAFEAGEQQGRLETLAGETKALVTGGNSVVWIHLIENPRKAGSFQAKLVHRGDVVPAFDIDIEIVETHARDGLGPWTMGQALTTGVGNPRIHFIPGFGPETMKILPISFEPSGDEAYYLMIIQMRNRSEIEQILMKKKNGQWHQAIRVQELSEDKTLLDEIDSGFLAAGETVNWPDLKAAREVVATLKSN
jgi:hypothetical protein